MLPTEGRTSSCTLTNNPYNHNTWVVITKVDNLFASSLIRIGGKIMKRLILTTLCLMTVAAIVLGTYYISMSRQIQVAKNNSWVQLEACQKIFLSKINKYTHLPFTISQERTILRLFEQRADQGKAGILLKAIQVRSGASAIYIMNSEGNTIAASNYDKQNSFVGKNYGFHPYFERAMSGREGSMYSLGGTTSAPGYYLSYPIMLRSRIVGVAVVKFELTELQDAWQGMDSIIMAKDPYGVIVLSSKKDWLYRTLTPLSVNRLELARKGRLYRGIPITPLGVSTGTSLGAKWIEIGGTRYLLNELPIRQKRWELLALTPWSNMVDHSIRISLIACLTILVGAIGILLIWTHRLKNRMEHRIMVARRARQMDRKREESLRQLADAIAHQIRNPLMGIGGNANLLKRKLPDDESLNEHLQTIINCCQDLEQVVVSVRDYIDILPSTAEPFDLESLIMKSLSSAMAEVNLPKENVQWTMDLEPATLPMDETLMGKALHEILCNAFEAQDGDNTSVEISGKWVTTNECSDEFETLSERCYTLTICDSGRGIDSKTFKHVKDPFFSTKPHGTGLGLAKAKRVMQFYNGDLSITSPATDRPGCNTMVQLTIPFQDNWENEQ